MRKKIKCIRTGGQTGVDRAALDLPVHLQDAGLRHHLWMDCSKIKKHGIYFCNTIDGLQKCIQDYNLS